MKAVLILSIFSDINTIIVCQWLKYFKQPYLLITPQSEVEIISIFSNGDVQLRIDGHSIKSSEIKSSWYRRGEFSIEKPNDNYSKPLKCGYNPYIGKWSEEF